MYIPETNHAILAVEPSDVAYSVTVDINTYITRAVNSIAKKIKINDFVKIFSLFDESYITIIFQI